MSETTVVRPLEERDLARVLELNQSALDGVAPLDSDGLARIVDLAELALVVDDGGEVAAFVITIPPGSAYDSPNYEWFEKRAREQGWAGHRYLDRVVVAAEHRRRGLGSLLYDEVEAGRAPGVPVTLEVYAVPPNTASLAFHGARGYGEIGRVHQANGKVAAMLVLL